MASLELRENAGKRLLFNRVFSLNNSHSKNVVVGLVPEGGIFVPTIRLVNQTWSGITFTSRTWQEFNSNYGVLYKHFTRKISKQDDISFDGKFFRVILKNFL